MIDRRPSSLGARAATARRARGACDKKELLRTRDLMLLAWLTEQYGARVDQLERLLGCCPRTVQRTLARLRGAGLVQTQRLLVGDPAWAIPTGAGMRISGHAFGLWRPRLALLGHVAAVNDVRLYVSQRSPDSQWISERLLARDRQSGEHLPDALVITDGQRVAIEVELTVKSRRRMIEILTELNERFDSILYFCAPGPRRLLEEFEQEGRWRKLGLRELPNAVRGGRTL